jgi:hypothetical protein
MPYSPGVSYQGYQLLYDALKNSSKQFNDFVAGFAMPNTSMGAVGDPNAANFDALAAGGGPQRDPTATMPAPKPSLMDRFTAGAKSSAEGFDRFKQDADESNALEKLLKTLYPDQKAQIDTMGLGEKRGMLQAGQVQQAMQSAKQNALVKMLQAQTALQRSKTAQQMADARATPKTPFEPQAGTRTITLQDGSTLEIPYITTSTGGAKSLDELVPNNPKYPPRGGSKTITQPPDKVKPPAGYEWIWNGKDWVMGRAPTAKGGGSMGSMFPGSGAAATTNADDPLGIGDLLK